VGAFSEHWKILNILRVWCLSFLAFQLGGSSHFKFIETEIAFWITRPFSLLCHLCFGSEKCENQRVKFQLQWQQKSISRIPTFKG
jgi:hypothetical protein